MKKLLSLLSLFFLSQFTFSQNNSGIQLIKDGPLSKWKWVANNNHEYPIVFELKQEKTDCEGVVTITIKKKTIYNTSKNEGGYTYIDDYGYYCKLSGGPIYSKTYTLLSREAKKPKESSSSNNDSNIEKATPNYNIANNASPSNTSNSSISPAQQQFMQQFQNIQNFENLKNRGIEIAKAFSDQVKQYSQLYQTSSPEALLQEFNKNLETIVELQRQNKVDNLNQVGNTLNAAVTDWSSGNYDGALFSTLSLLDQAEAKKEARRKAEIYKAQLVRQAQQKMSEFYWKAENLNNQTIDEYYKRAAYAFTKAEEDYLLEFVTHHECFGESMKTNFSFYSTSWTQNNCAVPTKVNSIANNLVAKDVQYIQAAERKYKLFQQTGRNEFQQGAIRFAAMAANTNPKADYYYLMGHYAGVNTPLVAYESFLAAKSKNTKYFQGEKASEFKMVELSLQETFKEAIKENNQDVIANIIGANLHQSVTIDGYQPIVYAIRIDQANVVQAFLNTELEGKPQSVINSKVQDVIMLAAALDAPKTIERFVEMGFAVDFEVKGQSPLDAAEKNLAYSSFTKITEFLGEQSKYSFENSDFMKVLAVKRAAYENDTSKLIELYNQINEQRIKERALSELIKAPNSNGFFMTFKEDESFVSTWAQNNRPILFKKFCSDIIYRDQLNAYKFLDPKLITLKNGATLIDEDYHVFMKIWIEENRKYILLPEQERKSILKYNLIENKAVTKYQRKLVLGEGIWDLEKIYATFNEEEYYELLQNKDAVYKEVMEEIMKDRAWDANNSKVDVYRYQNLRYINLIDFAISYRYDSKMFHFLSKHYQESINQRIKKYKEVNKQEVLSITDFIDTSNSPLSIYPTTLYPFNKYTDITEYIIDPIKREEILQSIVRNRYEIFKTLLVEYNTTHKAISLLVHKMVFSDTKDLDYTYYKLLIDQLIEEGYSSEKIKYKPNYYNQNDLNAWNTYIKQNGDDKYWKAVFSGNYNKRS